MNSSGYEYYTLKGKRNRMIPRRTLLYKAVRNISE